MYIICVLVFSFFARNRLLLLHAQQNERLILIETINVMPIEEALQKLNEKLSSHNNACKLN